MRVHFQPDELSNLSDTEFEAAALEVFRHQATHNLIYKEFLSLLKKHPTEVSRLEEIPFLPISFFKTRAIQTGSWTPEATFTSSGTTGPNTSRHFIQDLNFYKNISQNAFERTYGALQDWTILALLPSYLERQDSSLVFMVEHFIQNAQPNSGFFLHDLEALREQLEQLVDQDKKTLLIGVSFALLDLAEKYPISLRNTVVMETGGMKGRRREMVREELHQVLMQAFEVSAIHSEYGMTELMSQAYSMGNGIFQPPPWMKLLARDVNDPFTILPPEATGALNIIDLGNAHSCAFIATDDLGKVHPNGTFEILGRMDASDVRGCNLLVI